MLNWGCLAGGEQQRQDDRAVCQQVGLFSHSLLKRSRDGMRGTFFTPQREGASRAARMGLCWARVCFKTVTCGEVIRRVRMQSFNDE